MVARLESQPNNRSLCPTQKHMEEESARTPAGNMPQKFADHTTRQAQRGWHQASLTPQITTRDATSTAAGRTSWHDKASPAWPTPSKIGTTDYNSSCDAHGSRSHAMAQQGKPSAADTKQAWHDGSQLEMRRTAAGRAGRSSVEARPARQPRRPSSSREVPVAYVYWRYCVCNIYVYIATICLRNPACRQGVCLCGQSCYLICIYMSDMYMYFHHSFTQLHLPKLGV